MTALVDVSRETLSTLKAYGELIQKWSARINLVAPSTLEQLWERHILDSAQLVSMLPDQTQNLADLGSGGGLPGVVLSVMRPDIQVTLIESDQRKATFLRSVRRELNLSFEVLSERVEDIAPQDADVVTARALAPLNVLLGYVERHLNPDGTALLLKGRLAGEEIATAQEAWSFDIQNRQSETEATANVLHVRAIKRV